MVSTVSISLIILLLNEDRLDPTLIPSQFLNPVLMPLDSLFCECSFCLEPITTTSSRIIIPVHFQIKPQQDAPECIVYSLVSLDLSPPFPQPL